MSESEHSDSEFYYPGELSDAKMLQLSTHNEATERKPLLSNQEDARNEATLARACPRSIKKMKMKQKNGHILKSLLTE